MTEAGGDEGWSGPPLVVRVAGNARALTVPPEVCLIEEMLCWRDLDTWGAATHYPEHERYRDVPPGLLWEFIALVKGSDDDILAFARRHGVLGITAGGVPPIGVEPLSAIGENVEWHDTRWRAEPLIAWRAYANNADALTRLRDALWNGRRIVAKDILIDSQIQGRLGADPLEMPDGSLVTTRLMERMLDIAPQEIARWLDGAATVSAQRESLTIAAARSWLSHARVEPWISWHGGGRSHPVVELYAARTQGRLGLGAFSKHSLDPEDSDVGSLFSILALQLVEYLTSDRMAAHCLRCSRPYVPKRRVTPAVTAKQPNYCPRCARERRRETAREGMRQLRQTRRERERQHS